MTIFQLVGAYANALGSTGPDSVEVKAFREAHANNTEFLAYADSLDRIKRRLGGKGMKESATEAIGTCKVCDRPISPTQKMAHFQIKKRGLWADDFWVCSWRCLEELATRS